MCDVESSVSVLYSALVSGKVSGLVSSLFWVQTTSLVLLFSSSPSLSLPLPLSLPLSLPLPLPLPLLSSTIFASKELIISLIYITISRIPLLFAGMTIIEILSKGKYNGIGYIIWYYVNQSEPNNYSIFFGSTMLTIFFFLFFYFISEYLKSKLSPKIQKT